LSSGEDGLFNRNHDAMVSQYLIARLYSTGGNDIEQDLEKAWKWAQFVREKSGGTDLLYCCENSPLKKQLIEHERIDQLISEIEKQLPAETIKRLQKQQPYWKPTIIKSF
jgi:hypothetical protein